MTPFYESFSFPTIFGMGKGEKATWHTVYFQCKFTGNAVKSALNAIVRDLLVKNRPCWRRREPGPNKMLHAETIWEYETHPMQKHDMEMHKRAHQHTSLKNSMSN